MTRCPVKLYSRADGLACFEASLLPFEVNPIPRARDFAKSLADQLHIANYTSFWASMRTRPVHGLDVIDSSPRERRPLTQLNTESVPSLAADLAERNEDGYGRELVALITETGAVKCIGIFDEVKQLLDDFIQNQTGFLEMVIFQFDDSPNYVFVKSGSLPLGIENLLASWNLTPVDQKCHLPYRQLGKVQIESIRNNILALSFPGDPHIKNLRLGH